LALVALLLKGESFRGGQQENRRSEVNSRRCGPTLEGGSGQRREQLAEALEGATNIGVEVGETRLYIGGKLVAVEPQAISVVTWRPAVVAQDVESS
jgi:hypothetical protein